MELDTIVGGQAMANGSDYFFFLACGMERKGNGAVYRAQSCIQSHGSGAEAAQVQDQLLCLLRVRSRGLVYAGA